MIGLDSYSRQVFTYLDPILIYISPLNRLPIWNSQNCSMFPLAFVAGWLQGHWWGFISQNYVVWPTFFLMNVFIALKGSHFWFYIYPERQQGRGYGYNDQWYDWPSLCLVSATDGHCIYKSAPSYPSGACSVPIEKQHELITRFIW